jgi:hypothetical protein
MWWCLSMENRGGMMFTEENSLIFPLELSGNLTTRLIRWQAGGTGEGYDEFYLAKYLYSCLNFTCGKILRHTASGSTSYPKEGVLRILIDRKNPSLRPGLNPRSFCPMARTLTITPARRQIYNLCVMCFMCSLQESRLYTMIACLCLLAYIMWNLLTEQVLIGDLHQKSRTNCTLVHISPLYVKLQSNSISILSSIWPYKRGT